ncbi:MAG TPA: hypothetical protein VGW75_14955 [Solirubrobacteraceae bacterium]|jgi:hypothetical protein|nr:hypothetical protein [Solirubrobacteraceae bacterium]
MRRIFTTLAAGTAVLALLAPSAPADVVDAAVFRCETDTTWRLTSDATGNWTATMSYDTAVDGGTCKYLRLLVEDDLDPTLSQRDYRQAGAPTFNLVGMSVAANFAFAGLAVRTDAPAQGPIEIANGLLQAQISQGEQGAGGVQVHRGLGSCGVGCYRTRMVYAAASP